VFASSRTRYWSDPCMTGPGCFVYTGHIEPAIAIFARSSDFTCKGYAFALWIASQCMSPSCFCAKLFLCDRDMNRNMWTTDAPYDR